MAQRRRQDKGQWHRQTQELLNATNLAYQDITRATNIPENWLHRFATDKIKDPSINRVECLFRHLSENTGAQ
jgi:hypothetical protein